MLTQVCHLSVLFMKDICYDRAYQVLITDETEILFETCQTGRSLRRVSINR